MDPIPGDIDRHAVIPLEWDCLAAARQFQKLLRTKKLFIVPTSLFSLAAKTFEGTNLAYVFAPPKFFVAWLIGWPTAEVQ